MLQNGEHRHPRYYFFIMGLCEILDGLVRICSLTLLSSTFAFQWCIWYSQYRINIMKRSRK